MEYMKQLLHKENVPLSKYPALYADLFTMLGNQQDKKNVIKKTLSSLKTLKGSVSLVAYVDNVFELTDFFGDKEKVKRAFEDKRILKKVRDSKNPYFSNHAPDAPACAPYLVLPILAKEEFLGALCIHDEQHITDWESIHVGIHFLSVLFKYYALLESTKDIPIKDITTGLFNYRHFNDQLELETEKASRYDRPLSMILIDIHNFKLINDHFGYDAGDEVLKEVASWIKHLCRKIDMPSRIDSNTFGILLSETDIGGAKVLAERIALKIKNNSITLNGRKIKIAIHFHYVSYDPNQSNEDFMESAYMGLEEAKNKK